MYISLPIGCFYFIKKILIELYVIVICVSVICESIYQMAV